MMSKLKPTLYYVHDPMCSWCWGFRAVWIQVNEVVKDQVNIQTVLGGLAPDSSQTMTELMQQNIQSNWRRIQQEIPGTEFNYDFWHNCEPRRSTYPACRAVIAAGMQAEHYKKMMILAIQQAYYLHAKNPSDHSVLIQLAKDSGLDEKCFERDLLSDECKNLFNKELQLTARLNVNSFPNLVLNHRNVNTEIHVDYNSAETVVSEIVALI